MRDIVQIYNQYMDLKSEHADRDIRQNSILQIRANNSESIAPGLFSAQWPASTVSNFVDAACHDLAEVIAPLPSINANAMLASDDRSRKAADKKTSIANQYVEASRLQVQMYTAADRYIAYGWVPFRVEPNVDEKRPHIAVDDPMTGYPLMDRFGNCIAYAKRWYLPGDQLAAMYPEYRTEILGAGKQRVNGTRMMELVRWEDAEQTVLFIPDRSSLIIARMPNKMGVCPVVIAKMPSSDHESRGQFDDVVWIQLARAKMAALKLEAAHKAVAAPLALPQDVSHIAIGGDAIVRSATPEKIRRVELNVPPTIFAEDRALEKEMRTGARYPEARSGNVDASVVTGRGVQALLGGFDTQVKSAQEFLRQALQDVIALCFRMDEKYWGSVKKEIKGTENGQAYTLEYTPKKAIKGDYTVSVDYGLMAGLDPNRALVWGLQARSDKLISRQFLRKNLPVSLNATLEEEVIDIEDGRDALKQAVAGYVQAIPIMAQNGQDPAKIVRSMSRLIDARKAGKPIEEAVEIAFEPEVEEAQAGAEGMPNPADPSAGAPGPDGSPGGGEGGVPLGLDAATGRMRGVGTAGEPAGGRPDVRTMLAGLTAGGQANLSATTKRSTAI
jgi:hypothetical protein